MIDRFCKSFVLKDKRLSTNDLQKVLEQELLDLKKGRVDAADKVVERIIRQYGRDLSGYLSF